MTRTIGIYVFDNVELLDLAGPYEVFTCASRVHARMNPGEATPFRVLTIGQSVAPTRARAGLHERRIAADIAQPRAITRPRIAL